MAWYNERKIRKEKSDRARWRNFPLNFVEGFLRLHNEYRAIHGSPPLQIDDQLNEVAQEWAVSLLKRGVLEYKSDPEYGENIYLSLPRVLAHEIKPEDPLEDWYREGRYFKYGVEEVKGLEGVRHFTQLVWKDTKLVGLGLAKDIDEERAFFVCVYQPPGNVSGEFAENVLPVPQEESEMLPQDAEDIRRRKSNPDVVRSLERLYAVPSEKLRVWSIWLSKIGEIADEWQRWLRAHIDFAIRLMEQLQAAEEALSRSNVEEGDQPAEVSSRDGEEEAAEVPQEAGDSDRATLPAKSVVSLQEPAEEAADGEELAEEEETKEEVDDAGEASDEAVEDIGEKGDESEDAGRKMWPLGRPWEHFGLEDEIDEEPFERLPLPRSESEMSQFLKMFTHEATVYRSYYKHWRETADRAIDEIGGRTVMATFVVQGRDEHGQIKKQKPAPPKPKFGKRSKTTIKKSTTKSDVKSPEEPPRRESSDSNGEQFHTPLSSEAAINELPNPGTPTNGATREPSKVEMPTEEPASSKAQLSKAEMSKVRVIEVTDLVKDCARAQEPLPYIFYLKAEPDIDIAIEHDDVVVIEEDTDRENIVGDFRRVFFNLTDKPCKGGKPWMF